MWLYFCGRLCWIFDLVRFFVKDLYISLAFSALTLLFLGGRKGIRSVKN